MTSNPSVLPTDINKSSCQIDNLQLGRIEQQIELLNKEGNCKVIFFTSCYHEEGVSTVLSDLAKFMSQNSAPKKILIIDGNLTNPDINSFFNVPSGPGWTDVILNHNEKEKSLHQCNTHENVFILPCGDRTDVVSGKINKDNIHGLINSLKDDFDYIFIDSSSVLVSSDSLSIAMASHTTFLVLQANRVPWEVVKKLRKTLENNDCNVGGVVLNRFRPVIPEWLYNKL